MRTTLVLPLKLMTEAMELTRITIKTEVVKMALERLVKEERAKRLAECFGTLDLDLDIEAVRAR